ncbi:hypothetical protein BC826DRAFT_46926 [Russula brevipes]|nr:hypothetical protein BC826DRAFT_46926 [Russula brevipes]
MFTSWPWYVPSTLSWPIILLLVPLVMPIGLGIMDSCRSVFVFLHGSMVEIKKKCITSCSALQLLALLLAASGVAEAKCISTSVPVDPLIPAQAEAPSAPATKLNSEVGMC